MGDSYAILPAAQAAVARRAIAEESQKRAHVVVYLSGAHAYGFPSPDSDLDLKCVHIADTEALLGLRAPVTTFDRAEIVDGVEIDYTSNELGHVLAGILGGNGNFLERVLGSTVLETSPLHDELGPLVTGCLSKRFHRHYRGFAASQKKAMEEKPTAKKALYVLRTALTGTHLLRTGTLVTDLTQLMDAYGFGEARSLLEEKQKAERQVLADDARHYWTRELERAFAALDQAEQASSLPDEPTSGDAVDAWLVGARRERLAARS